MTGPAPAQTNPFRDSEDAHQSPARWQQCLCGWGRGEWWPQSRRDGPEAG